MPGAAEAEFIDDDQEYVLEPEIDAELNPSLYNGAESPLESGIRFPRDEKNDSESQSRPVRQEEPSGGQNRPVAPDTSYINERNQRYEEGYNELIKKAEEVHRYKMATANSHLENVKTKIELVESRLKQAKDDGDSAKEIEYANQLADLRQDKSKTQDLVDSYKNYDPKKEIEAKYKPVNPAETPEAQSKVSEWLSKNPWMNNPRTPDDFTRRNNLTVIDRAMLSEGYDPRTDAYYQELNRRLEESMGNDQNKNSGGYTPPRSPVNPVSSGTNAPSNTPRPNNDRVIITAEDRVIMRKLQLDPGNPEHLKRFAREKRNTENNFR